MDSKSTDPLSQYLLHASQSRPVIPFHLPPELIDAIASFVLHPQDLLHLAMVNSQFHEAITPFRLRYQRIECSLEDGAMWKHLEESTLRTDAIRSLHIRGSLNEATVPSIDPELEEFQMPLPQLLLARMKNLQSFQWDCRLSPRTLSIPEAEAHQESLFKTLGTLRCLVKVNVSGFFPCAESCLQRNMAPSQASTRECAFDSPS